MNTVIRNMLRTMLVLPTLALGACDTLGSGGQTSVFLASGSTTASASAPAYSLLNAAGATGNLSLDAVASINVTITGVQALAEGADETDAAAWTTLALTTPESLDLMALDLNGVEIAQGELEPGTYSNLRLFFSEASITLKKDAALGAKSFTAGTYPLFIPSGQQTGIKIPAASFTVTKDDAGAVTVTFNAAASVRTVNATGTGMLMTPVLGSRR